MHESGWILYSNFILFVILFFAILYSVFIAISQDIPDSGEYYEGGWRRSKYPRESYRNWREQGSNFPDFKGANIRNTFLSSNSSFEYDGKAGIKEPAEKVPASTLLSIQRYAQFSAIASYCTTLPSPSPCIRNWTSCVDMLASDDNIIQSDLEAKHRGLMSPPLTRKSILLKKFSSYFREPLKGGEGYIALDIESENDQSSFGINGTLVLGFGGSTIIADWINDFSAWATKYVGILPDGPVVGSLGILDGYVSGSESKVHAGVFQIYSLLRMELLSELADALEELNEKKINIRNLALTGHSLGGALAYLALLDIRQLQLDQGRTPIQASTPLLHPNGPQLVARRLSKLPYLSPDISISLYTYGQPRISNIDLIYYSRWLLKSHRVGNLRAQNVAIYRMTHKNDLVPFLPPNFLGYFHDETYGKYWIDVDVDRFLVNPQETYWCTEGYGSTSRMKNFNHKVCKFNGWTSVGHISYYWNFDKIAKKCKKIEKIISR